MGLDGVELVMEVEDEFGIDLPDSELSQIRTVADLAALVLARLPRSPGVCPTARMFYAIRRLFTEHAQITRSAVLPAASLDDLFPANRRRIWRHLREQETKLPRLRSSDTLDAMFLLITAAMALASVGIFSYMWVTFGGWVTLPSALAMVLVYTFFVKFVKQRASNDWPQGTSTVGDLARAMAPFDASYGSPGERLLLQMSVLEKVRQMTSEQLRLPLEKVKPESSFADDLEMD